jgi:hypothetical protein
LPPETARVVEKATWTIPQDAEAAEPGSIVQVPFEMGAWTPPITPQYADNSALAQARRPKPAEKPVVRYQALAFQRSSTEDWLLYAERTSVGWTYERVCPHGTGRGVRDHGVSFEVLMRTLLDSVVLHTVLIVNDGPVAASIAIAPVKGRNYHDLARHGAMRLQPGAEFVLPIYVRAGAGSATLVMRTDRARLPTLVRMPLAPLAGHPGGSNGWCPGSERLATRWSAPRLNWWRLLTHH